MGIGKICLVGYVLFSWKQTIANGCEAFNRSADNVIPAMAIFHSLRIDTASIFHQIKIKLFIEIDPAKLQRWNAQPQGPH